MKILIIGGNRFIGKTLVSQLLKQGHDVSVLNRGNITSSPHAKLTQIYCDRNVLEDFRSKVQNYKWDVVYDMFCKIPNQAIDTVEVVKNFANKFIFVSTQNVYKSSNLYLTEADFDPYSYDLRTLTDNNPDEYMRQCEAIFHQRMPHLTRSVRLPIVLGPNDPFKRVEWYINAIQNQTPIHIENLETKLSIISLDEAVAALEFIIQSNYLGAINCSSSRHTSAKEFIEFLQQLVGKRAVITKDGQRPPLNWTVSTGLSSDTLQRLGFTCREFNSFYSMP